MKQMLLLACTVAALLSLHACSRKTTGSGAAAVGMENKNAGRSVTEEKCVRCHRLYQPDEYTLAEWKPILKRMIPKARTDSAMSAAIVGYIERNAKKS